MPTDKNIKSPQILYSHFEKYRDVCKSSPKRENIWSVKSNKQVSLEREIPLTWEGFEVYLRRNKVVAKLDDYKANKDGRYSEYADIIHVIGLEIWEDQYSGASAGVFQHNIIARKLGLIDKQEITETKIKVTRKPAND